jgi:hypothetical protein
MGDGMYSVMGFLGYDILYIYIASSMKWGLV